MSPIERRIQEGTPDLRNAEALPGRGAHSAHGGATDSSAAALGTSHAIRWIPSAGSDTRMFLDALEQAFGGAITKAVAHEFGLSTQSKLPLAESKVRLAIDAAELGSQAMAGVQFAATLRASTPPRQLASATLAAHAPHASANLDAAALPSQLPPV